MTNPLTKRIRLPEIKEVRALTVRPGLVGNQPAHSQLQASQGPPSQYAYPVECFGVGLGGCVQRDRDKGNLHGLFTNPHLT